MLSLRMNGPFRERVLISTARDSVGQPPDMKGFRMRVKIPERGTKSDLTPARNYCCSLNACVITRFIYLPFAVIEVEEESRVRRNVNVQCTK